MEIDFALPIAFALGFVSGFRHAFEPDHVIAVSTLLHDEPDLRRALRTGIAWGAGHTTMLMGGVLIVSLLRIELSDLLLGYMDLPVALMLLGLGVWALFGALSRIRRLRRHTHDGIEHYHVGDHPHPHGFRLRWTGWQGYAVGLVHGLAGSGALLLLVAATMPSLGAGLLYAVLFGAGSILGMAAITAVLMVPFLASRSRPIIYHAITGMSGSLSIILGLTILYAAFG